MQKKLGPILQKKSAKLWTIVQRKVQCAAIVHKYARIMKGFQMTGHKKFVLFKYLENLFLKTFHKILNLLQLNK